MDDYNFFDEFDRLVGVERDGRVPFWRSNVWDGFPANGFFYPQSAKKTPPRRIDVGDGHPANPADCGELATGNKEMADKINELYNEINLKDKDLRETRETVRRLQGSVREFRERAETAERCVKRILAKHEELLGEHESVKRELASLKNRVNTLLSRIRNGEFSWPTPCTHGDSATSSCRMGTANSGAGLRGRAETDDEDFDGLTDLIRRIAED